jgi:hypothetical protein
LGGSQTCPQALSIWLELRKRDSEASFVCCGKTFRCLNLHSTEGRRVSSQPGRVLAKVDQPFAGSNGHASSKEEGHLKEVALNPRRRVDYGPNFFCRGGSVSCPWSLGPGSRPGVACLSRADDRVMHPRFSLKGGVGRTRSQDSVAGTDVLVEFCACVNALFVFLARAESGWLGHRGY